MLPNDSLNCRSGTLDDIKGPFEKVIQSRSKRHLEPTPDICFILVSFAFLKVTKMNTAAAKNTDVHLQILELHSFALCFP